MRFVLTLHSHLPYVLYHGRWPHGSDWLCEAALDTYLPILGALRRLDRDGVPAPLSIGVTPVLAAQLADATFVEELEAFFEQRLVACAQAPNSLKTTGETGLLPLVRYWQERFVQLRNLFRSCGGDIVGALRELEEHGRIELIGSAATHGFLPLLRRDESVRLQLEVGRREHIRLFGRSPAGCWLPECAYRPRGPWTSPTGERHPTARLGIEEHLAATGFKYFFADAHLAAAGPAGPSTHELWEGAALPAAAKKPTFARSSPDVRSPYRPYWVASVASPRIACLVRDPQSARQVWSRQEGYPGDEWYLEFHKIRWPGGLKFWRVSGPTTDLGDKRAYEPDVARHRVQAHASHFRQVLTEIGQREAHHRDGRVIVAPFDTELFGHWWFEGVDFISELYRQLHDTDHVEPVTASTLLDAAPPADTVRLTQGSWGADGDFSMWLNDRTAWTWERLGPLEDGFWDVAPDALHDPAMRPLLAQAARELLLAQASDWQFIISTGLVADYAERRFREHCDHAERLLRGCAPRADAETREHARRLADELATRNGIFPDVLESVRAVSETFLAGTRQAPARRPAPVR